MRALCRKAAASTNRGASEDETQKLRMKAIKMTVSMTECPEQQQLPNAARAWNEPRPVIVYCDHLLYASETFIKAQATALTQYRAEYAGLRRVTGLDLANASAHVMNQGGVMGHSAELMFKMWRRLPGKFVARLQALSPALIHAHFGADGYRALTLSAKLRVPLIVTYHGSDVTVLNLKHAKTPFGHRQYLRNREIVKKKVSRMIAVSQFVKAKLLDQGFPEDKVTVHYIGVDTELFRPAHYTGPRHVLFVGRLVERKGLEYLIRGMESVQNQFPEVELVVIGDGPLRSSLEAQARSCLRRYQFMGVQRPEVVREQLGQSLVLAGPSVKIASGEEEAFGMVFAEAQSMEIPVVSFASGGIGEAVEHRRTGLLAPERDWRTLGRYIGELIKDETMRQNMGRAGRQRVLSLFDLKRQTLILEDIYSSVVANIVAA
jgi:glycosyltransferase involved in cell wall biosynthesis